MAKCGILKEKKMIRRETRWSPFWAAERPCQIRKTFRLSIYKVLSEINPDSFLNPDVVSAGLVQHGLRSFFPVFCHGIADGSDHQDERQDAHDDDETVVGKVNYEFHNVNS